jgi:hypothetical protein
MRTLFLTAPIIFMLGFFPVAVNPKPKQAAIWLLHGL